MIDWKLLRAACLLLLLIPVVHLAWLVSRDTLATLDASPEAWAPEMAAYVRADKSRVLPERPVEVVGGERVQLWHGLEALLAPRPVLMRALGDATVEDITHYYDRLIGYYKPGTLVFLPGNSEFHIRDHKDAGELVQGIGALVALDAKQRATRHIVIFTPLKTPLYPEDSQLIDESTRLLESWASGEPRVAILDANALLRGPGGKPDPAYFRFDGVNLNEHGYLRLSLLLKSALEKQETGRALAES